MNCHTCYCNATSNPPCGACEACTHGPDFDDDRCENDCDDCTVDHDAEILCYACDWYHDKGARCDV